MYFYSPTRTDDTSLTSVTQYTWAGQKGPGDTDNCTRKAKNVMKT